MISKTMDCSTKSQYLISTVCKNLMSPKEPTESFDIKPLLELLHVNNDVNVQARLLSTLSAYVMTNEESRDIMITYNSLYDKICIILSNCPPKRAVVTFNFLSALLYSVDEDSSERTSLKVYAKNMIRNSGCLAIMCDLFTSCMMHQDVWRSLCRCLAETCRGVEANQSYCTHLVPMCIQRCSQRNIEVFSVLQNLLQNHTKNINLFLECNGISVFQRQFLQHDECLQLLSMLAQSSTEVVQVINGSNVSEHMRDFLRVYGPDTQLGKWATIILYYISDVKGSEVLSNGKLMTSRCEKQAVENKTQNNSINNSIEGYDSKQCSTDTAKLLQNIIKEITYCPPSDLKYLQGLFPPQPQPQNYSSNNRYFPQAFNQNKQQNIEIELTKQSVDLPKQNVPLQCSHPPNHQDTNALICNEIIQQNATQNSSFSFQNVNHKRSSNVTLYNTRHRNTEYLQETRYTNVINSINSTKINESILTRPVQNIPKIHDFKPKFASTPKKTTFTAPIRSRSLLSRRSIQHSTRKLETKRRIQNKVIPKRQQQHRTMQEHKHRSLSGWFFETINESCTTLVKTVRNIFKSQQSFEVTKQESLSPMSDSNPSCSFSFTNYMRKRDAILKNECTKKLPDGVDDFSMETSNSCHTCNDTIALKHKLANDEYLKQTVRKLKLGVNLYGCDFKKISKQLWPQQTYMTPVVLYNLYRKLIIK